MTTLDRILTLLGELTPEDTVRLLCSVWDAAPGDERYRNFAAHLKASDDDGEEAGELALWLCDDDDDEG